MKKQYKPIIIFFIIFLVCFNIPFVNGIKVKSNNIQESYKYYNYQNMTSLLVELYNNNSDIMHLGSLDKTYEKRDVWFVKISDNVSFDENEPGVLLMGAHHGNEKPSFEVLIYFIKHIIENYRKKNTDDDNDGEINEDIIDGFDNDLDGLVDEDPSEDRVREVVNNTQIFLIPMVSPDGVEANSRKNCAPNYGLFDLEKEITSYGVNLNRNYGFKWHYQFLFPFRYHITNIYDSSFNYRGPRPFSENESRAVKSLVEKCNISISLSYHSYLEAIFFPWTHTSLKTPHEELFISVGKNITKINKYKLLINGFRNRSYIIPRLGGNLGTAENWMYGVHEIIAYTVELCKTRVPTDPKIVNDYLVKHLGVNLYVCERSWTIEDEKTIALKM